MFKLGNSFPREVVESPPFGGIRNLTGHPPGQPALDHPASSTAFGLDELKRSLLTKMFL